MKNKLTISKSHPITWFALLWCLLELRDLKSFDLNNGTIWIMCIVSYLCIRDILTKSNLIEWLKEKYNWKKRKKVK